MANSSQLNIRTVRKNSDAEDMANTIFDDAIQILGASFSGDRNSGGIYTGADGSSPNVAPSDSGVILSTGNARDITNTRGVANSRPGTSSDMRDGMDNQAGFNAASGGNTYDAAYLDVDFIPDASVMTMQFTLLSENYPEVSDAAFQDVVGIWVNGTQISLAAGDGSITPENLDEDSNPNLYVDNNGGAFNTEMDGFTITLTVTMNVNPGEVNSLRIGIADVGDANYDSNLLIAAESVQTQIVAIEDQFSLSPNWSKAVDVLANDLNNGPGAMAITHINGQGVAPGDSVTLPTGQAIKLNADGTLQVTGDGDAEDFTFTYGISNGEKTDVGIVNATSIPCFVVGTLIDTPRGSVAVETLRCGDLVLTKDDGPQPIRWIGQRTVEAKDKFAPVHIARNTFGRHGPLNVSPLHRILIGDTLAELLFGEPEVLVAARDLIDGRRVVQKSGGEVTYVHLMFDRHQVIFSDGLATESFLPGPQTTKSFERDAIDEICAIFPELDPLTGEGYSAAARRTLRRFEANLLFRSTTKAA